ncbi:hypothetical protein RQN30_08335 [Arcanobacterium hippocoleae]
MTNENLFGAEANSWLGYVLAIAGMVIAVVAPALGQSVDRSGKSASVLTFTTLLTVAVTAGLFLLLRGVMGCCLVCSCLRQGMCF